MDKLRIPTNTVDIIKSFVFYNIHSHAYYKVISKTKGHIIDNHQGLIDNEKNF